MNNKRFFRPLYMLAVGLCLGAASRWLDVHTQNLGNIFSQLAIWILLGTLISIYSRSRRSAMGNVLLFCLGMLVTYYAAAAAMDGVYSGVMIAGWTIFALCSPVFAYFAWMTKERGPFSKILSVGIVLVSLLSSVVLFDGPRIYDLLIDGILVYVLFFKKIER